jgi:cytochrome c oxidase subunit IV
VTEASEKGAFRAYGTTWVALIALAATSLVLSRAGDRQWAATIALVIAGLKALLIALFFMHLSRGRVSVRLGAFTAVALLAVLSLLTVADILTRSSPVDASSKGQP